LRGTLQCGFFRLLQLDELLPHGSLPEANYSHLCRHAVGDGARRPSEGLLCQQSLQFCSISASSK
jgi:hypothetical protein